jgi:hypothetical protein
VGCVHFYSLEAWRKLSPPSIYLNTDLSVALAALATTMANEGGEPYYEKMMREVGRFSRSPPFGMGWLMNRPTASSLQFFPLIGFLPFSRTPRVWPSE